MMIDRVNTQWSIDFVKKIFGFSVRFDGHSEGFNIMENLFTNHESALPGAECPCCIFNYEDMMWDNPGQDICRPDEVVLSEEWPYEEEDMQVLTYDRLKEIVIIVLREDQTVKNKFSDEQIKNFIKRIS